MDLYSEHLVCLQQEDQLIFSYNYNEQCSSLRVSRIDVFQSLIFENCVNCSLTLKVEYIEAVVETGE